MQHLRRAFGALVLISAALAAAGCTSPAVALIERVPEESRAVRRAVYDHVFARTPGERHATCSQALRADLDVRELDALALAHPEIYEAVQITGLPDLEGSGAALGSSSMFLNPDRTGWSDAVWSRADWSAYASRLGHDDSVPISVELVREDGVWKVDQLPWLTTGAAVRTARAFLLHAAASETEAALALATDGLRAKLAEQGLSDALGALATTEAASFPKVSVVTDVDDDGRSASTVTLTGTARVESGVLRVEMRLWRTRTAWQLEAIKGWSSGG